MKLKNEKDVDVFINKLKDIHNNLYEYDIKVGQKIKYIDIICKIHGKFTQKLCHHIKGSGCPECSSNKKYTKESIIKKANIVHNNKYKYIISDIKNAHSEIIIICPIHGEFKQTISNHINQKNGCPICKKENRFLSKEEFIKKANIVHNFKYNYDNVIYIDNKTYVNINCPIHGMFNQKPSKHLLGQGCPHCNKSKGEIFIRNYLIENNIKFEEQKMFNKCKNIRKLKFDFYLPELNICIEYDGKQHYEISDYFGGFDKLEKQIIRDKIKTKYCLDNIIKLIRIRYDENIEERLKKINK
jgi:very-short-patch-repair endonuclease